MRWMRQPKGVLPTFLVIGAARCGTTSLHAALAQHPDVVMAAKKELRFFAFDGAVPAWNGPSSRVFRKTSVVSLQEYKAQFSEGNSFIARGESSPLYLYADGTAERIRGLIPAVRLIVVLRDPAERALSHFQHLRRLQLEPLPDFRAALAAEDQRLADGWAPDYLYRRRGFYFEQLRRFYDVFSSDQISVHRYDDLLMNPSAEMSRMYRHIGVSQIEEGRESFPHTNASALTPAERQTYSPVLQSLKAGYCEDLQELGKLVGRDFTAWM